MILHTGPMDLPPNGRFDFPLNITLGALFLGTCFSLILYGGIAHQTVIYYQTYPNDRLWLKALVLSVLVLESAHTALCIHMSYTMLVTEYSNLLVLENLPLSFNVFPSCTALIIALTQAFFVRRAFLFGKQFRRLAVFVAGLSLSQCVLSIVSAVNNFKTSKAKGYVPRHPWVAACAGSIAAAADVLMTGILTISLHRSKTGLKRSDSMMDVLILYSVTTGLLTSASALVFAVLAIIRPNDMIYLGLSFMITKLYTNTLLAALNSRQSLRDAAGNSSGVEIFGLSSRLGRTEPCIGPRDSRSRKAASGVVVVLNDSMYMTHEGEGTVAV